MNKNETKTKQNKTNDSYFSQGILPMCWCSLWAYFSATPSRPCFVLFLLVKVFMFSCCHYTCHYEYVVLCVWWLLLFPLILMNVMHHFASLQKLGRKSKATTIFWGSRKKCRCFYVACKCYFGLACQPFSWTCSTFHKGLCATFDFCSFSFFIFLLQLRWLSV